jgi:hypothetical protein
MKSSVIGDLALCNQLKINRRFGGTHHLHYQARRMSQTRNQPEAIRKKSVISQKTPLFMTTAVKTTNPAFSILTYVRSLPGFIFLRASFPCVKLVSHLRHFRNPSVPSRNLIASPLTDSSVVSCVWSLFLIVPPKHRFSFPCIHHNLETITRVTKFAS